VLFEVSHGYINLCSVKIIKPMCCNSVGLARYKLQKLQAQSLDL
jgi:hypothetical protein